jgi:NitT/TauT family transport system permease protein
MWLRDHPDEVAVIVLGAIVLAAWFLLGLGLHPLFITTLAVSASLLRVGVMMIVSVGLSLIIGVGAARSRAVELVVLPIVDVLEAVPVISFFPVVLLTFVYTLGAGAGTELAADFLILTALIWNIILGVYESVRQVPAELIESTKVLQMNSLDRFVRLYAPGSFPSIASNLLPSFASALFYLSESEIIAIGAKNYTVFGIGSLAERYIQTPGDTTLFVGAVLVLLFGITVVVKFVLEPMVDYSEKFKYELVGGSGVSTPWFSRLTSRLSTAARPAQLGRLRVMGRPFNAFSYIANQERRAIGSRRRFGQIVSGRLLRALVAALISGFLVFVLLSVYSSGALKQTFSLYTASFLFSLLRGTAWDGLRILSAYGISLLISLPLAYLMVTHRLLQRILYPVLENVASFPVPLIYPLILSASIFLLGRDRIVGGVWYELDVLLVTVLSAIWYILFNFHGALKRIPSDILEASDIYGLQGLTKWRYVILPGTAMSLITGSMEAIGSFWAGLMIADYFKFSAGTILEVRYGLMKILDVATYSANITEAGAVTLFMIFLISIITFTVWYPLLTILGRRYRFD